MTFSKAVLGVNSSDLLINGTPATSVTGSGTNFTFTFAQPNYGTVSITWAAGHGITDVFTPPAPFDRNGAGATWQYQLLDEMRTQARLGPTLPDPVIRRRLLTKAEELELPLAARTFKITRGGSPRQIVIETEYSDSVNLFLLHRAFVFRPRATEPL